MTPLRENRGDSLESLSKAELIAKVRTADAMYRLLIERLENASNTIGAYQQATGTDYPGSLREHQKVPDLFAAGKAFREQWGLPDLFAVKAERDRLRTFVDNLIAGRYFGGGWADKIMSAAREARDA